MRSNNKKKIIAAVLAAALAVGGLGFGVSQIEKRGLKDTQFGDTGDWGNDEDEDQIELLLDDKIYVSDDNIDTYLLIGTDAGGKDMGKFYKGELADFLTLLVIDNTTKKYAFIEIDRNTIVDMTVDSEDGGFDDFTQQICIAHWYGESAEQRNYNTVDAVAEMMGGMDIDNYYTLNMNDIGSVNKALGGVEVKIESDMTNVDPAFKQGETIRLTDEQAEAFVRSRMSVGEGTNKERMSRQTQYMQSAYNQIMSQLREKPEYINDIYDNLHDKVQTDEESNDLSRITNQLIQYENQGILTLDGKVKTGETLGDGVEHEEFYLAKGAILDALSTVIDLREAPMDDDEYEEDDEEETEDSEESEEE